MPQDFEIKLATGVLRIRETPAGIVCDIHTHRGQRLNGTWASTKELQDKCVINGHLTGNANVNIV